MNAVTHKRLLAPALAGVLLLSACTGSIQPSPTPNIPPTPIVATQPKVTVDWTATPLPSTSTKNPSSATPAPPPATITASGPTVESSEKNSKAFNQASPKESGPFTRVDSDSIAGTYGSTLEYKTPEGAVYQIVLFITRSAGEANERFSMLSSGISGKQALKLGDESFITTPPTRLYIGVRWRNITLEMYRPDPKGTTPKPISDSEALKLIESLYASLPTQ
jgi:hypothetical protein